MSGTPTNTSGTYAKSPRLLWRRWFKRLVLILVLAAPVLLYAARGHVLPPLARFLDVSEAPRRADYVMVLGGGYDTRPFVAAALVKAGLARRVLLPTFKQPPDPQDDLTSAEHVITQRVLVARGVPDDAIVLLPDVCASTFDEAQVLAKFLDTEPQSSVAVVTTSYHTRRARWIFQKKIAAEQFARVQFVAAPTEGFDETNWWRFEQGFGTYVNEYFKLGYYRIRY